MTNKKRLKQEILEKNSNHSFQLNIAEDEMAFTEHVQNEGFDTWIKYSNYHGHPFSGHPHCNIKRVPSSSLIIAIAC